MSGRVWLERIRKRLVRALLVSWREQPSRYDIEALQANVRRVGLVVRVRWTLIIVLIAYSLLAGALYTTRIGVAELVRLMAVPAAALGFVVLYNTYYARNYRRLGNIAIWNNVQLALDAMVVTVLVYFSGGVNSWFWSMYALFILEAAFILPRSRDAWLHALLSCVLLGAIEWLEFARILPHIDIPYASPSYHADIVFVAVRYSWQVAVLLGTAWVATNIVGEFRHGLAARRAEALIDPATGLFARAFFLRVLASETRRASRDQRRIHLLLFDIDRFNDFNERFGFDRGDRMLIAVASAIAEVLSRAGDPNLSMNIAARFGGEEFAVLFTEDLRAGGAPSPADARRLAEEVRSAVAAVRVDGAGVTLSAGVASWPDDAMTSEELLDAADGALVRAVAAGGDRVVLAGQTVG